MEERGFDFNKEEQNANDRQAEKKVQKDLDIIRAYKTVFNGAEGKRVLFDLMKSCSFNVSTYSPDYLSMAHNEGRRSVVLDILKILKKDESDILAFFKQQTEREKEYGV